MMRKVKIEKVVLVGVLKGVRDRELLFREHWYHVPLARMPAKPFAYVAFYEPAIFGREGKRIRCYAKVRGYETALRRELFPSESGHSHANERYVKIFLGPVQRLARPVRNADSPRRVSFGFTTLQRLRSSRNMLELFHVAPTEQIIAKELKRAGIRALPQHRITGGRKRYRLDFAVFCRRGGVAVECDNKKAHSGKLAKRRDAAKDRFLEKNGWTVVRLSELAITFFLPECIRKIKHAIRDRGGMSAFEFSKMLQ